MSNPIPNSKPFPKGQSGNLKGRPRKVFSTIIAEMKARGIEPATATNVADIYQYLLSITLSEVMEIAGNPKQENGYPAIMRLAAKELLGKRGLEIMREMLDRANGKANQQIGITADVKGAFAQLPESEIEERIKRAKELLDEI